MNRARATEKFLPFLLTLGFSTIFVQALMFGYDSAGMSGMFIASAIAYIPLGLLVGFIWSPRILIVSVSAGIPTWLFIVALHQWSIVTTFTTIVEDVPLILEPVSVSVFFLIGAWIGKKLHRAKKLTHTSA